MASGFPDWHTWAGRTVGGESVNAFTFTGDIAAGATGTIDVGQVSTGKQKFYQALVVATPDDTAIHVIKLTIIVDGSLRWIQNFITSGNYEIPGFNVNAGDEVRISITNNSAVTLDFSGSIFSTERDIT